MFFNDEVEKLRYKTEVVQVWTWVSLGFSVAADYKFLEKGWLGSIIISALLMILAVYLNWRMKQLQFMCEQLEEQERDREEAEFVALAKQEILQKTTHVSTGDKAQFAAGKDVTYATGKEEYIAFIKELRNHTLEENLVLLDSKYQLLSSEEKMAAYGEYQKSVQWLKDLYAQEAGLERAEQERAEAEQAEGAQVGEERVEAKLDAEDGFSSDNSVEEQLMVQEDSKKEEDSKQEVEENPLESM